MFLRALCYNAGTGMIRLNLSVSHLQKTAQICQIKLDEKRDSRQKALGLFCVYGGISRGERSGAEIEENEWKRPVHQEIVGS